MLRLGLIPRSSSGTAHARLVELGAVEANGAGARPSLDEPGVALVDLVDVAHEMPHQHLVIDVVRVDEGDRAADPRADVTIEVSVDDDDLVAMIDALWRDRIVPFADNLHARRRAPRRRTPLLFEPDGWWARDAARLAGRLDAALGRLAVRIDHIGSTSVPGLRAKDLIDIQVTVPDLDHARAAADAAREAGFVHVDGDWFGEDRFGIEHPEQVAVDADPGRPTNVNFRPVTAPVWQEALLFRDWLASRPNERMSYEAMKMGLAADDGISVDRYSEDKMPWIHAGLARAERWATDTGWMP